MSQMYFKKIVKRYFYFEKKNYFVKIFYDKYYIFLLYIL